MWKWRKHFTLNSICGVFGHLQRKIARKKIRDHCHTNVYRVPFWVLAANDLTKVVITVNRSHLNKSNLISDVICAIASFGANKSADHAETLNG